MTDPLSFPATTARLGLPLLFAGQAQKEVTVNEALATMDFLLHGAIEAEIAVPPASPTAGQMWLVARAPQGEWTGQAGKLAGWTDSGWRFMSPTPGMRVFDRYSGAFRLFDGQWHGFSAPEAPQGGATVDVQARAIIALLIAGLSAAGIFSAA